MNDIDTTGIHCSLSELVALRNRGNLSKFKLRSRTAQGSGQQAVFRGRGMEFAELRAYQPGDDLRDMDWRVTARTGKPHTRLYQEERERLVFLCVDGSPGMHFGTRGVFKVVQAARIAAVIGWRAVAQGDRVGGLVFNQDGHVECKPNPGERGLLPVLRTLVQMTQGTLSGSAFSTQQAAMTQTLQRLAMLAKPGSRVVIVSDFLNLEPAAEQWLGRMRQHCEVVAVRISDPLETAKLPLGQYGFTDGEQQTSVAINSKSQALLIADAFKQQRELTVDILRRSRCQLYELATNDPLELIL